MQVSRRVLSNQVAESELAERCDRREFRDYDQTGELGRGASRRELVAELKVATMAQSTDGLTIEVLHEMSK
jgi:hypothetical protein